ncbi:MAG: BsuPI-related putative proteinase inhibitor [Gemmatimonas sp.]|jgi:hypothetical protein|uniref:BsuPI-related putative proteinase inhibitor n=1 Tax=Gemmatimonas sp. TaxID=1962908 RepID=UPI00391FC096|nr:BsuPI-related putative proteinase inhibitor [Gemmatimonadota bacterium]
MLPRIVVPLLAAAALVFACGPRTPNPVANARPKSGADRGIVSHVLVDTADGTVRFAIEVTNDSPKRVELTFPNGRTHDFAVRDSSGREVWRWSAGRLFTQAMQNRLLDSHYSTTYDEHWSPPGPGRYTLEAQLHSENHPVHQRVAFSLQ